MLNVLRAQHKLTLYLHIQQCFTIRRFFTNAIYFSPDTIYLKVGDQLALPGGINTPVQHILWKLNANKVVEWDPFFKTTVYGEFKNRTTLDIATGHISIRDVRTSDSGIFYFEFNHTQHKSIKISVISK